MRRFLPLLLLGILAAPAFATPVAILRWDVCDDGSPVPRNKDFVAGSVTQVVSARGLSGTVRGISFEIEVRGSAGFGDAWRFDAAGCNAGAVSFSISAIGKSCPGVNSGQLVVQSYQWDAARGTARVRLASSLTGPVVLDSTRTYVLGRVIYDHTNSVPGAGGGGACGGADLPMCFELLGASYLDEGGAEHSFAFGNQTLTWQDAAQTSNCFAGLFNGVRLDEFLPTCGIADTTVQFLELRSPGGDHYSADLHIRVEDHLNAVTFDRGDLFGAALEGTPWPANAAWLLATTGFATIESFAPDLLVSALLDPVGGRVTLYDGRPGGPVLQVVAYGAGTVNPLPPAGQSLVRVDDAHYMGSPPSPASSAGGMPNLFACSVGNERVVIREVLPQCANGGTGGQFIELEAPIDQRFQEDMRLVVKDGDGSVRFNVSHLFSPQGPGAAWSAGQTWLLGPSTFVASAGIAPDRIIGSFDQFKGSIELYGGPGGSLLVDHLDYGAGTPNPGGSLERVGSTFVPDYTPSPTNFAGATGVSPGCYCPGPLCADASVSALRIDEVALRCANGTTTTQFVELRSTGTDQAFHADLRLRIVDPAGVPLFDGGNLFPGRAEGEAWPNGVAWLLALGGPAGTELTQASGVVPDAVLPVTLDPAGGSITLYDGRSGGAVVHALSYGPVGRGESWQRGPDDVFAIVATQEPENRTGVHAAVTTCPCGTNGIAIGSGPYVYSTEPVGQRSLQGGTGAYDLHAGTIAASAVGFFSARGMVKTSDLFVLTGPSQGQEVAIRATLRVTGSAAGGCSPVGHCSGGFGAAFLRSAGGSAGAALGNFVDKVLVVPLVVRVGEPWSLETELIAEMAGEGQPASASYAAQIGFLDYPSGMSVTSCAGFVLDGPTATLPSIVAAGCDDGVVHLEWSIDHALVDATVERTELGDRWQSLGAPEVVGDELARYDDRGVEPGKRYGYRLSWSGGSTEIVWVEVQAVLALRALSANPSAGTPTLEFTLPKPARVRIEVLDLRGRRVESRDLGMQDAGAHRLAPGAALRPGVYWARLLVEGKEERLKLIVL